MSEGKEKRGRAGDRERKMCRCITNSITEIVSSPMLHTDQMICYTLPHKITYASLKFLASGVTMYLYI